jgi:hypothetical protein
MKNLLHSFFALLSALGVYLGFQEQSPLLFKPLVSIESTRRVVLAGAPAPFSADTVTTIKKFIATDLATLLTRSIRVFDVENKKQFLSQWATQEVYDALHEEFAKRAQEAPIFLLRECRSGQCSLSRSVHPENRLFFEDAVLKSVSNRSVLVYTSIGAGTLFQDFIMLSKLAEQGVQQIVYIAVDPHFKKFLKVMQRGEFKPPVQGKTVLAVEKINRRLYQFLSWFAVAYPQLQFDMYLFADAASYIQAVKQNSIAKSDLIVGVDLTPEPNAGLEAFNTVPLADEEGIKELGTSIISAVPE